jgi:two-component system OmpR family response regulator
VTAELKKIVIVEDEPDTAEMFAEMMRLSGYEVHKTFSGTQGQQLITEMVPDAVVLDLMMPDVSGLEVLRYMRATPALQDIPVIIVTARVFPADIQLGLEAGATVYLTKPVGFKHLKQAVEDAIDPRISG